MLRTTKKSYYSNLNMQKITDNKIFWKTIIPLFTERSLKGEKFDLIENRKDVSNDTELSNIANGFFCNITSELNISVSVHSTVY